MALLCPYFTLHGLVHEKVVSQHFKTVDSYFGAIPIIKLRSCE